MEATLPQSGCVYCEVAICVFSLHVMISEMQKIESFEWKVIAAHWGWFMHTSLSYWTWPMVKPSLTTEDTCYHSNMKHFHTATIKIDLQFDCKARDLLTSCLRHIEWKCSWPQLHHCPFSSREGPHKMSWPLVIGWLEWLCALSLSIDLQFQLTDLAFWGLPLLLYPTLW